MFFLVSVLVVVGIAIKFSTDEYESSAKLFITEEKESTVELITGVSNRSKINSEVSLLNSRGLAEAVVDEIGADEILYAPANPQNHFFAKISKKFFGDNRTSEEKDENAFLRETKESATGVFMRSFKVGNEPLTNVIDLSYTAHTPEHARKILSSAIEVYVRKHIDMHSSTISLDILTNKTENLRRQLDESKLRLKQFKDQYSIVSFEQQQIAIMNKINDFELLINQTQADIEGSQAALRKMEGKLDLLNLYNEEAIKLESLNARLDVLNTQRNNAKNQLTEINAREQIYNDLQNKIQLQEANYKRYLSNLEQARIAQTLESERISNVKIMQEPTFIDKPQSKKQNTIAAMGLFVGLLGGIGLAFSLERMDHTIKSPSEIELHLQLPSIAALPRVKKGKVVRCIKKDKKAQILTRVVPPKSIANNVTGWLYAQQTIRDSFEILREGISKTLNGDRERPYILAVTSCYRGEGVSTIATGIAFTTALFDKQNILLVDLNLHHPNEDKFPGVNRPAGLFEMTIQDAISRITSQKNPGPGEDEDQYLLKVENQYLLKIKDSNDIDTLLPTISKLNYKLIILDLPSLAEGAAAIRSARSADGVLLIMESECVRREVALKSRKDLEKAGANVCGVVINKRRYHIPTWLYKRI